MQRRVQDVAEEDERREGQWCQVGGKNIFLRVERRVDLAGYCCNGELFWLRPGEACGARRRVLACLSEGVASKLGPQGFPSKLSCKD
eukprot:scaffold22028_cov118-Isochrysis_galbana.AAC.1